MSEFQCLFDVFRAQPSLSACLTLDQVVHFVVYATRLRNDILLVQPADHLPERVPDFLPHSVEGFLSEACSIHLDFIPALWGALRETVWGGTFGKFLEKEPHLSAFSQHGHNHGLSMFFLHEFSYCFNVNLSSIFQNSSPYNLPTITSMPKSKLQPSNKAIGAKEDGSSSSHSLHLGFRCGACMVGASCLRK